MQKILHFHNALNFLLQNKNKYLLHRVIKHKNGYFTNSTFVTKMLVMSETPCHQSLLHYTVFTRGDRRDDRTV